VALRVDCYPDIDKNKPLNVSKQECERRGCIWSPVDDIVLKHLRFIFPLQVYICFTLVPTRWWRSHFVTIYCGIDKTVGSQ
jgi:hypothetical protein